MRMIASSGSWARLRSMVGCGMIVFAVSACSTGRMVYDHNDVRIGIEPDPSVGRATQPVANAHPAQLTTEEIKTLLGALRITAWSGTVLGIFAPPQPVPLLTDAQLNEHAAHFSEAFAQAGPNERILFSFPKPDVHYSEDRTTGALFLRERYLHIVVTDVSFVSRPDTGEDRLRVGHERDMKAMKLWIAKPSVEAMVPDLEEPQWAPFETVHISLNVKQTLTRAVAPPPPAQAGRGQSVTPTSAPPGGSQAGMQEQIRDLTNSNQELQKQLDEQKSKMKDLTDDMNRLKRERDHTNVGKPPARKAPAQ
jgi:hypothetical protein